MSPCVSGHPEVSTFFLVRIDGSDSVLSATCKLNTFSGMSMGLIFKRKRRIYIFTF